MPIFDVEITIRAVVEADSVACAEQYARSNFVRVASDTGDPDVSALGPLAGLNSLPPGWNGSCLPFGGDGISQLKDILPETSA